MNEPTLTLVGNLVVDPELRRFWEKVEPNGPVPDKSPGLGRCWQWIAGATKQGYGGFHPANGVLVLAHRYSYELLVGPIPQAHVIDHLCRNRRCVNPSHLEAVTNKENLRRGAGYGLRNGMRTACVNGHPYTSENTYTDPAGGIRCRECARIRDRQPHRRSAYRRALKKENAS